jgi:hypothetical protein
MIGPRLTDPRAKVDFFLGLFRFSEEKEKVQEILKARTHVISSNLFRQPGLNFVAGSGDCANSPMSVSSEGSNKPFLGIKGLAGARERVTKPIVKSRTIDQLTTPQSATVSAPATPTPIVSPPTPTQGKWSAPGAAPNPNPSNCTSPPRLPFVTSKSAESTSVTKEPYVPYSQRVNSSPDADKSQSDSSSTPSTAKVSASEFASLGKVQRMIKSYSSRNELLEQEMVFNIPAGSASNRSSCGRGASAPLIKKERVLFEMHSDMSFVPPEDRNKLSPVTGSVTEDDGLSSECTSVEGSEGHESEDSAKTWRQALLTKETKGLGRDMNRLSFERKKLVFSNSSAGSSTCELSECSTNESSLRSDFDEPKSRSGTRARAPSMSRTPRRKSSRDDSVEAFRRKNRRDSSQSVASSVCATAIGKVKDLTLYKSMPSEGPVGEGPEGTPLYRYYELVRMNFVKNFEGIKQSELVFCMVDDEFLEHFGMNKVIIAKE